MPRGINSKLILPLFGIVFVAVGSITAIMFARGYRPDFNNGGTISPSGIMVATSYPDGAQLLVDGTLKTATNNTINLPPNTYEIEIKKDGFLPWKKTLKVSAEIVTRATATLFPSVPSLRAITSAGAAKPALSPDGSKIAYIQTSNKQPKLYVLDLSESALGFINRDPKLLHTYTATPGAITWTPDSRQLLTAASSSAILIDLNDPKPQDVTERLNTLRTVWSQTQAEKEAQKQATLPKLLREILSTATKDIAWSPKENKLLYTATASAIIPENLIRPLPGSSTQPETRQLTPGGVYVYDLEEDRNFQIDIAIITSPSPTPKKLFPTPTFTPSTGSLLPNTGWTWFPDSSHLIKAESSQIIVKEYDNQNQTIVYSGPMEPGFAAAYPSGKQVLILSNLNPATSPDPNLYAVSLR